MRCAALTHVPFEDVGVWAPVLASHGYQLTYVSAGSDLDALAEADLAIVLGGPMGVGDVDEYPFMAAEVAMVAQRLEHGKPTLGVCLGAQVMAAALGARVYPATAVEIGWSVLDLTAAAAASPVAALAGAPVLHWHGETFDVPAGAELLAATPTTPHQAFALGNSLALQFHAEADGARIDEWLVGHAGQLAAEGVDVDHLRAHSSRVAASARSAGVGLLGRYLTGLAN